MKFTFYDGLAVVIIILFLAFIALSQASAGLGGLSLLLFWAIIGVSCVTAAHFIHEMGKK